MQGVFLGHGLGRRAYGAPMAFARGVTPVAPAAAISANGGELTLAHRRQTQLVGDVGHHAGCIAGMRLGSSVRLYCDSQF